MVVMKHEQRRHDLVRRGSDLFDQLFDDMPTWFRRPIVLLPERGLEQIGVEEYTEDETLVVKVELAGVDPDKDVQVTVDDEGLHVQAERSEEEHAEGRDYVRRELRYGAFRRDLPLPVGTTATDVKASYKDGILEIRVSLPEVTGPMTPIEVPIAHG